MAERPVRWEDEARRLYEQAETRTADAWEDVVRRDSFGELLARMTENVMGLTRIGNDTFDLLVRNLRIAGRRDITRLATQLARTEDKLELVLQELELLRDELAARDAADGGGTERGGNGRRKGTTRASSTR